MHPFVVLLHPPVIHITIANDGPDPVDLSERWNLVVFLQDREGRRESSQLIALPPGHAGLAPGAAVRLSPRLQVPPAGMTHRVTVTLECNGFQTGDSHVVRIIRVEPFLHGSFYLLGILLLLLLFRPALWENLSFVLFFLLLLFIVSQQLLLPNNFHLLFYIATGFLILSPFLLLKGKAFKYLAIAVVLLFTVTILIDHVYFNYFEDFPSIFQWVLLKQVPAVRQSILELTGGDVLRMAGEGAAFLLLLFFTPSRRLMPMIRGLKRIAITSCILLFFSIYTIYFLGVRNGTATRHFLESRFTNIVYVKECGIIPYHILDLYAFGRSLLAEKGARLSRGELDDFIATRARHGPHEGEFAGFNVIIVQVESLQTFAVAFKVGQRPVMPHYQAMAHKGYYFPNCLNQTGMGHSSDAEFAVINSLLPSARRPACFAATGHDFNGMPKILAARGYETIYAHPYVQSFWNRGVMMRRFGFQERWFRDDFRQDEMMGWGLSDGSFLNQVADRLETLKEPYLLYLTTLSGHHPYNDLPPRLKTLPMPGLEGTIMGDYLAYTHYKDAMVNRFVERVLATPRGQRTLFVFFGDHNAGLFGDPHFDRIYHTRDHPVNQALLDVVPLLFYAGTVDDPVVNERYAGQIDVAPTILSLLGIDAPNAPMLGEDLFAPHRHAVVTPSGSWVNDSCLGLMGANGLHWRTFPLPGKRRSRACEKGAEEAKIFLSIHIMQ